MYFFIEMIFFYHSYVMYSTYVQQDVVVLTTW
jgi:hypothetical protein